MFKDGECVYESPSVMDIRTRCLAEQNTLWDETRRLINPHHVYIDLSQKLWEMKHELIDRISEENARKRDFLKED